MGKKATLYLVHVLVVGITFVVSGLSIAAHFAGMVTPDKNWFISILGSGMIMLLIVNLFFVVYWLLKRRMWALVPLSAMLFNIGFIRASFRVDFNSSDAPCDLKVLTYNVHAFGTNKRAISENISAYLYQEGVDVACFQEVVTTNKYTVDDMRQTYKFMPYSVVPGDDSVNKSSLAVFSRYPIVGAALIPFGNDTDNSAMWVDVDINGRIVRVFNVHFQTTNLYQSRKELAKLKDITSNEDEAALAFTTLSDRMRRNAIRRCTQVWMICKLIDRCKSDIVLCGDFNETPASYAYNSIDSRLNDGFLTGGSGFGHTFKSMTSLLRIDYVFTSDKMESIRYSSPNLEWSDHKPVVSCIEFKY